MASDGYKTSRIYLSEWHKFSRQVLHLYFGWEYNIVCTGVYLTQIIETNFLSGSKVTPFSDVNHLGKPLPTTFRK